MTLADLLRFCTVSVIWCTTSVSASKNSTTGGTILTPATVPSISNLLRKIWFCFLGLLAFTTSEFSEETCLMMNPPSLIYAPVCVAWKQAGKWWKYKASSNWFIRRYRNWTNQELCNMFDPTIPYTLFTKWRKIQTEQNVLKCGKKFIFLNVRRMFLYQYMLESRLSRWTRCCSLSFSLNQLFYVQVDYSYLVLDYCSVGEFRLFDRTHVYHLQFWFVLTFCALFLVS